MEGTMTKEAAQVAKDREINVNRGKESPFRFREVLKGLGYTAFMALREFIDNAVKAGASEIRILFVKDDDGTNKIIIRDDASGIAEDRYEKLGEYGALAEEKKEAKESESLGQNNVGCKGALAFLADNGYFITVVNGAATIIYPKPDKVKVKKTIVSSVDQSEVEKIGANGTSVVLSALQIDADEWDALRTEVIEQVGVFYHRFMEDKKRKLKIWVDKESIDPINPAFPEEASSRVSDEHNVQILRDESEGPIEIDVSNDRSVRPGCLVTHVPHKGLTKKIGRKDLADKYYPKFLKDGTGLFIYRNERLICWLPISVLDGAGGRLHSLRICLFFSTKDAGFIFDSDVKKNGVKLTKAMLSSIREKLNAYFKSSMDRRDRATDRLNKLNGKVGKKSIPIGAVVTIFEEKMDQILKENPAGKTYLEQIRNEVVPALKAYKPVKKANQRKRR